MSIWTASELDEQITAWKATLLAVSKGQDYRDSSGRQLTSADLPEIRKTLRFLEGEKQRLTGNSGPVFVSGRIGR